MTYTKKELKLLGMFRKEKAKYFSKLHSVGHEGSPCSLAHPFPVSADSLSPHKTFEAFNLPVVFSKLQVFEVGV
jgi:hypothetical protein